MITSSSSLLLLLFIIGLPSLLLFYYSTLTLSVKTKFQNKNKPLPNHTDKHKSAPEPSGVWPVIGHLHLLIGQIPPHRVLGALSDKYGPIFTVRLGVYKTLVISSKESVKDCFTTNDKVLAKRPESTHGVYLGYNYAGFGFTHGPYWRHVRKLVLQEMLCGKRLEMMRHVRESEVHLSIVELYNKANQEERGKVAMSQWMEQLSLNMIMRMINGRRYTETTSDEGSVGGRSFREVAKEFMYISGQAVVSDLIPFSPLRWLDFRGHIKSMKRIADELSLVCDKWIDEHIEAGPKTMGHEQDFIDVMLSTVDGNLTKFGHERQTIIKATILSLILAGSDTTSVHLVWILSLLLNNRAVMQRAKDEIDEKVGKDRWVQESDIKNLVYLQAIVKETLRLYPPGPLAVPHEAMEDCTISGYHIAKGTRVMVNLWKLQRDPSIWTDPDEFMPERFLRSHGEVDFSGHHHQFIPFGTGRRSCPGASLAMQVTHLTMARLLQGFDIETPLSTPVGMEEGLGITLVKATPLDVLIKPRFSTFMYQN